MKHNWGGPALEIGAYLIALFLPLAFNPYATRPVDDFKAAFVRVVVAGMCIVTIWSRIYAYSRKSCIIEREMSLKAGVLQRVKSNPFLPPVLVYSGIYILASFNSLDPELSFLGGSTGLGAVNVLCLVLLFLLSACALRNLLQIERLVSALIVGSVPVVLYGWVQVFGWDPLDWSTGSLSSIHSTAGYSLYLGAYLAMVVPFTLARMVTGFQRHPQKALPYAILAGFQVTCLLFTQSRGAWLGLLGGGLVFLWLLAYRQRKKTLTLMAIALLLASSVLLFIMSRGWVELPAVDANGFSDRPVTRWRQISNNDRLWTWKYTLEMIPGMPLLGYGPETYAQAFWSTHNPELHLDLPIEHVWDPHNIFLYHLSDTGILGTLAFLWLLYVFYRITLKTVTQREDRRLVVTAAACAGSVTAFLIPVQFNPNAILPFTIFWLVLALGVSAYREGVYQPDRFEETNDGEK